MKRKFTENLETKKKTKTRQPCSLSAILNDACATFDWKENVIDPKTQDLAFGLRTFYNEDYDSILETVVPYILRKYSEKTVRQTCFGGWILLVKIKERYHVFDSNVRTCPKSLKIFFNIAFFKSTANTIGHANMLLIDREEKTVELWDPHGYNVSSVEVKHLMNAINDFLLLHGYQQEMISFEKIQSLHFCPTSSYKWQTQTKTCRWFSLLYLVARLLCPFLSRREIVELFVSKGVESEQKLMTNFYCFLALNVLEAKYEAILAIRKTLWAAFQSKTVSLRTLMIFEAWIRAGLPLKALKYAQAMTSRK